MLQRLREMRAAGEPLLLCAEAIGVGYPTVVYKARELRLADRLNSGRKPGRDRVLLPDVRRGATIAPL
jgi:hypothetical protein